MGNLALTYPDLLAFGNAPRLLGFSAPMNVAADQPFCGLCVLVGSAEPRFCKWREGKNLDLSPKQPPEVNDTANKEP